MSQQTLLCKTAEDGFIYFWICVCCSQENVLKGKPVPFGVIQVKRPQNVVFHYIHSNQNLINLILFDDIE